MMRLLGKKSKNFPKGIDLKHKVNVTLLGEKIKVWGGKSDMKTVSTRGGLDATALKLIGVVTMTIDHIGYILFPNLAVLRIIGRLAYPIFAYLIAEGCTYSRHKAKSSSPSWALACCAPSPAMGQSTPCTSPSWSPSPAPSA